jgi:YD repeat-containing protein
VVDGEPDCRITYTPAGRIAMVVRSDGASWEIGYDAAGRMIATEGPDGVTEMERDALGRVTRRVVNGTEQRYEWGLDGRRGGPEPLRRAW